MKNSIFRSLKEHFFTFYLIVQFLIKTGMVKSLKTTNSLLTKMKQNETRKNHSPSQFTSYFFHMDDSANFSVTFWTKPICQDSFPLPTSDFTKYIYLVLKWQGVLSLITFHCKVIKDHILTIVIK